MTIDKDKLIGRLGEKTGLDPDEAEERLKHLLKDIHEATQQGESFKIEGFGEFSMEQGALHFYPSRLLQMEINYKYAGMKPIELIGAFKESETGEMPEMAADLSKGSEVWAFDQAEAAQEEPEEGKKGMDKEPPVEKEPEKPEEEPNPVASPPSVPPEKQENAPVAAMLSVDSEAASDSKIKDEQEEAAEETEKAVSHNTASDKEEDKDSIGRFVAVAVSILLFGICAWMGYHFLTENNTISRESSLVEEYDSPGRTSQPAGRVQNEDHIAAEEQKTETAEENPEPDSVRQVINNVSIASEAAQSSPYGLQGTINEALNSWYAIVVHSLRDEDQALANEERLENKGFRVKVSRVQIEGSPQYRVGIGQFPTVEKALEAVKELSEPYKSNNFIKRF